VAISQGNLTISVRETPAVSQPSPFGQGETVVTPQSSVQVDEEKGRGLVRLPAGALLGSLVSGLNALGVTPRDMISILQAIKAAGALQPRDRGVVGIRSARCPHVSVDCRGGRLTRVTFWLATAAVRPLRLRRPQGLRAP